MFIPAHSDSTATILLSCSTLPPVEKLRINLMHPTRKEYRHSYPADCGIVMRLIPYVKTFLLLYACIASIAAEAAPQPSGKWQILPTPSTDEGAMALSLKAEKLVTGWMKTSVPVLTIECSKGKPAVYIETGMGLEVTMVDQQIVHLQLDDNKPITQRWREVTNATISASTRDSTALIRQLTQSQKFLFKFTPFNSAPAQAEFAVNGLSTYSPQLGRACWGK